MQRLQIYFKNASRLTERTTKFFGHVPKKSRLKNMKTGFPLPCRSLEDGRKRRELPRNHR
ncbi:hypothetical protein ACFX15_020768 [Malus domestica]